ncbi:MAG: chemotaxis-specific protein-glutamate methyltransferase CheB [Myxococcales bacterium]|nr:chemotaxis-specific protein-glutamate methyltransferase CheB [Myxococcales bacterium]
MTSAPIRVFLVDDSRLARIVLRRMLARDASMHVVGEASDGVEAIRRVPLVDPDVVLMDMQMPGLDGLAVTRELMANSARPILIVSDLVGRDADLNFRALAAGALDLVRKPTAADRESAAVVDELHRKIRIVSRVPVVTRRWPVAPRMPSAPPEAPRVVGPPLADAKLVVMGASTGGPIALQRVLQEIGAPPSCPVLIVQHMAEGFTRGLAEWLSTASGLPIDLARDGCAPEAGQVYLAPDGAHLVWDQGRLRLRQRDAVGGHRPSVDVLFESVAASEIAPRTLGVLLTGMGADGARGLGALRAAGAWTVAQDEASSVVYGMPKVAVERGAVSEVLPLDHIGARLRRACGRSPLARGSNF